MRSIDKAMGATQDGATRKALAEARSNMAACLALHGVEVKGTGPAAAASRRRTAVDAEAVLGYLRANPDSRSEQIASALGTDTKSLRPVLQRLKADDQVGTEGKGRATTYSLT